MVAKKAKFISREENRANLAGFHVTVSPNYQGKQAKPGSKLLCYDVIFSRFDRRDDIPPEQRQQVAKCKHSAEDEKFVYMPPNRLKPGKRWAGGAEYVAQVDADRAQTMLLEVEGYAPSDKGGSHKITPEGFPMRFCGNTIHEVRKDLGDGAVIVEVPTWFVRSKWGEAAVELFEEQQADLSTAIG